MNNLKSNIITYKILKKVFSLVCAVGIFGFLLFSLGENVNTLRNGWISITLMLFGIAEVEYCNFRIRSLKKQYFALKRNIKTRNKIIEFEKIA